MKFHDDIYLWNTICIVTGKQDREDIYDKLYGNVWTVQMIEELI